MTERERAVLGALEVTISKARAQLESLVSLPLAAIEPEPPKPPALAAVLGDVLRRLESIEKRLAAVELARVSRVTHFDPAAPKCSVCRLTGLQLWPSGRCLSCEREWQEARP